MNDLRNEENELSSLAYSGELRSFHCSTVFLHDQTGQYTGYTEHDVGYEIKHVEQSLDLDACPHELTLKVTGLYDPGQVWLTYDLKTLVHLQFEHFDELTDAEFAPIVDYLGPLFAEKIRQAYAEPARLSTRRLDAEARYAPILENSCRVVEKEKFKEEFSIFEKWAGEHEAKGQHDEAEHYRQRALDKRERIAKHLPVDSHPDLLKSILKGTPEYRPSVDCVYLELLDSPGRPGLNAVRKAANNIHHYRLEGSKALDAPVLSYANREIPDAWLCLGPKTLWIVYDYYSNQKSGNGLRGTTLCTLAHTWPMEGGNELSAEAGEIIERYMGVEVIEFVRWFYTDSARRFSLVNETTS